MRWWQYVRLGSATARHSTIEYVWIIWSRTSLPIGTLTIMDTIYDKQLFTLNWNMSYHVNIWSEPETGNKEIYVYVCVSCVQSIKRYEILSMS